MWLKSYWLVFILYQCSSNFFLFSRSINSRKQGRHAEGKVSAKCHMREEETALCEEMMRRWRRHSDDDERLDKWKEWGGEGRRDGEEGRWQLWQLPTSSTPSTSGTNLNVMIGSAVVDMSLLYPAFFCVSIWPSLPCQGPRVLKCEQIIPLHTKTTI